MTNGKIVAILIEEAKGLFDGADEASGRTGADSKYCKGVCEVIARFMQRAGECPRDVITTDEVACLVAVRAGLCKDVEEAREDFYG